MVFLIREHLKKPATESYSLFSFTFFFPFSQHEKFADFSAARSKMTSDLSWGYWAPAPALLRAYIQIYLVNEQGSVPKHIISISIIQELYWI